MMLILLSPEMATVCYTLCVVIPPNFVLQYKLAPPSEIDPPIVLLCNIVHWIGKFMIKQNSNLVQI